MCGRFSLYRTVAEYLNALRYEKAHRKRHRPGSYRPLYRSAPLARAGDVRDGDGPAHGAPSLGIPALLGDGQAPASDQRPSGNFDGGGRPVGVGKYEADPIPTGP